MDIYLFKFSKRENSTKQPVLTSGVKYEVTLKDTSGILNPVMQLDLGIATAPDANYMYVPDYNRYYWLTSPGWVWDSRRWVGYFTVDSLASWKSGIGSTSAYVLRSASQSDGFISDHFYPMEVSPTRLGSVENTGYAQTVSNGCYVVGVITGDTPGSIGATTYYVMDRVTMASFLDAIINTTEWSSVTDVSNALLKTFFNPYQYIVSCTWFPFDASELPITASQTVHFGWWSLNLTAPVLSGPEMYKTYNDITIPKHPQAQSRGAFLDTPPYSNYQLEFFPFGIFEMPNLAGFGTLRIQTVIDLVTATAVMKVYGDDSAHILLATSTQFGMPIQLAQSGSNILSGAAGAVTGSAQALAGIASGAVGVGITGAFSAISSGIEAVKPSITVCGFNGSKATLSPSIILDGTFYRLADEDNVDCGRPLCKVRTISNLSGFIMCADPDPQIACSQSELSDIIGYMTRGFFYE